MYTSSEVKKALHNMSNSKRAKASKWFFKTGKGQYGEGDKFIGVTVPNQRKVASSFKELSLQSIEGLLKSKIHEHRLTALFILVNQFKKADPKRQEKIYNFYFSNTKNINNWDLVDSSASYIVGKYLHDNTTYKTTFEGQSLKGKDVLFKLAKSNNIWERRIAMIAAGEFIKHNQFDVVLRVAKMLLSDKHDLIHKAVGWMLREVGKKDQKVLEDFLKENYAQIPRTALRYAIERFPMEKRSKYLKGKID